MINFSPAKNSRASKSKRRREFRNSRRRINQPEKLNNRDLNVFFPRPFLYYPREIGKTRRKGRKRRRRIAHYAHMVKGRAFDHRWRKPGFDIWTMCIQRVQKPICCKFVISSFDDVSILSKCENLDENATLFSRI